MKEIITYDDIMRWAPCYDPADKGIITKDWSGTVFDILELDISIDDKFWALLREEVIPARELRLFAVWCARQVQHLMTDERSFEALDVAEKFADGTVSLDELLAASNPARDAARTAWVASDAAWAAAKYTASDTAWAAAWAAAKNAGWSAKNAAWNAEQQKQLAKLITILEELYK